MRLIPPGSHVLAIPGDVADPEHRRALAGAAHALGGLDLLVCNAAVLGPSPLPELADFPLAALRELFEVYPVASLVLIQEVLPSSETFSLTTILPISALLGLVLLGTWVSRQPEAVLASRHLPQSILLPISTPPGVRRR